MTSLCPSCKVQLSTTTSPAKGEPPRSFSELRMVASGTRGQEKGPEEQE